MGGKGAFPPPPSTGGGGTTGVLPPPPPFEGSDGLLFIGAGEGHNELITFEEDVILVCPFMGVILVSTPFTLRKNRVFGLVCVSLCVAHVVVRFVHFPRAICEYVCFFVNMVRFPLYCKIFAFRAIAMLYSDDNVLSSIHRFSNRVHVRGGNGL